MEHENRDKKRQSTPYHESEDYWREHAEELEEDRRMEERAGIF